MPKIEGLDQNSPEWIVQRVGCLTASKMYDASEKLKNGKWSAARNRLLAEVAVERLTGRATEHFVTPAMERGLETEPRAVAAYEIATGADCEDGGFWMHDSIEWFGASPDRIVSEAGLLEVKCPTTVVHLDYLEADLVPLDYMPQMLAQLVCTGRKWCDFASFDDRLPRSLQLFVKRFEPEPILLQECENMAKLFLEDVVLKLGRLAERVQEQTLAE